jgi:neutral ceramidase
VMLAALKDLAPAKLSIGQGMARFAMNRREPTPKGIINGRNPEGPVDHSVPVLKVEGPDGKLKAVVFGYACHNTTMQFYEWCGDYAGFAQIELQKKHPEALALFWIGCGADANPLPRSKIELCEKYGKDLAEAVEGVLDGKMAPLTAPCRPRYDTIALPFDTIPTKEQWEADLAGKNATAKARATRMLKMLEAGQKIPESYRAYPVQVWRFGDELTWVALGGETVVDYARRLKKELTSTAAVWVTGYANDVMAYIPSERVLKEGGYEGDTSMVPYGLPAKWAPGIEEKIVSQVHKLAK